MKIDDLEGATAEPPPPSGPTGKQSEPVAQLPRRQLVATQSYLHLRLDKTSTDLDVSKRYRVAAENRLKFVRIYLKSQRDGWCESTARVIAKIR